LNFAENIKAQKLTVCNSHENTQPYEDRGKEEVSLRGNVQCELNVSIRYTRFYTQNQTALKKKVHLV